MEVKKRAELVDVIKGTGKSAGEIEAEAIDMHLGDPIAEAIHEKLETMGMHHIECIAASGEIHIMALLARDRAIIGPIIDAAERERRDHARFPSAVWL